MDAKYWQKAWSEDRTGFHQKNVNKRLIRYWPELRLAQGVTVFVPLCGKSSDMLWLHQNGYQVLGCELSDKAVRAFYDENQLDYIESKTAEFHRFTGVGKAAGLDVWAGDYFDLKSSDTAACCAFYDRASLIAMKPSMRADYARQLINLTRPDAQGLLLTIAYDESRMNGPPFSVPDADVHLLLGSNCTIEVAEHYSGSDRLGNLAKRGLETLEERVYLLKRNF